MSNAHSENPEDNGTPVPRDPPDQQAEGAEDAKDQDPPRHGAADDRAPEADPAPDESPG